MKHASYDDHIKPSSSLDCGLFCHCHLRNCFRSAHRSVRRCTFFGGAAQILFRALDFERGSGVAGVFCCTLDAKGKTNCGGLRPRDGANGMFGGPGAIESEKVGKP